MAFVLIFIQARELSMMEDGLSESLKWSSRWAVGFSGWSLSIMLCHLNQIILLVILILKCMPDERCAISCEGLDQSSEGWLVDCLTESKMHCIPDEMSAPFKVSLSHLVTFDLVYES